MALMSPRAAVSTIFFVNGFTMGGLAVELPLIKERLQIGDAELGRLLLALAIGAIAAMPFAGMFARWLGNVGAIRVAGFAYVFLVAAVALPFSYWSLAAIAVVMGSMNGMMDVTMNAEGVTVERAIAKPIMSSLHGFWSIGGFAAAAFAWLVLDRLGSTGHFLASLAIGLVLLVPAVFSLTNVPLPEKKEGGSSFSLPNRATLPIGILTTMAMVCEGAMLDWGPIYLRDVIKVSPGVASLALFAFSGGMAAGRFSGDWIRGHWSAVFLTRVSGLAVVFGFLVVIATNFPAVVAVGFFIAGIGLSNLVPIMFGAGARVPGVSPETAVAGIATVGYSGFLIGPTVIGWLSDHFGLGIGLSIVLLFGAVITLSARVTRTADADHPPAGH